MKDQLLKLAGALAIVAIVGFTSITSSNAQEVSLDEVTVQDVNPDAVAARSWYVVCGSGWCVVVRERRAVEPSPVN